MAGPDGTVEFRHVVNLSPDSDIIYLAEQTTNLLSSASWSNMEWSVVITNAHEVEGFDEKVLQTDIDENPAKFFRFRIQ